MVSDSADAALAGTALAGTGDAMSSSPRAASLSLTGSSLKAHLDASRRPPHTHNVRRVVSSNVTPRKKKKEEQQDRPKTVAATRSTQRSERSPCRTRYSSHSPEKCAAPTPPPSRSNSTHSSLPGGRTPASKAPDDGQLVVQPSSKSSPKRRTPSKLKLRDSLTPVKVSSPSPSSRSSPGVRVGGDASPRKREDPRTSGVASPPKNTPPKLKLKRSTPTPDLASLGRSPSQKSPARSVPAGSEQGDTPASSRRKTHRD